MTIVVEKCRFEFYTKQILFAIYPCRGFGKKLSWPKVYGRDIFRNINSKTGIYKRKAAKSGKGKNFLAAGKKLPEKDLTYESRRADSV
jgi:hypothetical protein